MTRLHTLRNRALLSTSVIASLLLTGYLTPALAGVNLGGTNTCTSNWKETQQVPFLGAYGTCSVTWTYIIGNNAGPGNTTIYPGSTSTWQICGVTISSNASTVTQADCTYAASVCNNNPGAFPGSLPSGGNGIQMQLVVCP
jgi:hypothetical protein